MHDVTLKDTEDLLLSTVPLLRTNTKAGDDCKTAIGRHTWIANW